MGSPPLRAHDPGFSAAQYLREGQRPLSLSSFRALVNDYVGRNVLLFSTTYTDSSLPAHHLVDPYRGEG